MLPAIAPALCHCANCDGVRALTVYGRCETCGSESVMRQPLMFRRDKVSKPEFYRPQMRPRPRGVA